jgi:hypothetical protein
MNYKHRRHSAGCLVRLLLIVTAACPAAAAQADNAPEPRNNDYTIIDTTHEALSDGLDSVARLVDSFFDDERYIAEDAATRLRITQLAFLEQGESIEYKTRGSLSFSVPRLKNRLRLFVAGEEANEKISEESLVRPPDEGRDEGAVGLQYFTKATDKKNISLTTGVKLESRELFIGPRYRRTFDFDTWQLRFVQRLRWFTDKGWEATTRLDYERLINNKLFFRHTTDGRWREEDDGYRYSITPALTQKLTGKKALEYQLNSQFETRPNHRLDRVVARIRLRQRIYRHWLFLETNPQIAFANDDDFDPAPGISVLLEVVLGGKDRNRKK